ncbi:kinase-like protein [Meredithblackwellia eburnea MCA 4105]
MYRPPRPPPPNEYLIAIPPPRLPKLSISPTTAPLFPQDYLLPSERAALANKSQQTLSPAPSLPSPTSPTSLISFYDRTKTPSPPPPAALATPPSAVPRTSSRNDLFSLNWSPVTPNVPSRSSSPAITTHSSNLTATPPPPTLPNSDFFFKPSSSRSQTPTPPSNHPLHHAAIQLPPSPTPSSSDDSGASTSAVGNIKPPLRTGVLPPGAASTGAWWVAHAAPKAPLLLPITPTSPTGSSFARAGGDPPSPPPPPPTTSSSSQPTIPTSHRGVINEDRLLDPRTAPRLRFSPTREFQLGEGRHATVFISSYYRPLVDSHSTSYEDKDEHHLKDKGVGVGGTWTLCAAKRSAPDHESQSATLAEARILARLSSSSVQQQDNNIITLIAVKDEHDDSGFDRVPGATVAVAGRNVSRRPSTASSRSVRSVLSSVGGGDRDRDRDTTASSASGSPPSEHGGGGASPWWTGAGKKPFDGLGEVGARPARLSLPPPPPPSSSSSSSNRLPRLSLTNATPAIGYSGQEEEEEGGLDSMDAVCGEEAVRLEGGQLPLFKAKKGRARYSEPPNLVSTGLFSGESDDSVRRASGAAATLAPLHHIHPHQTPRIVLLLEYCPYGNVWSFVKSYPELVGRQRWLGWAVQLARAVKCLHEREILHSDIKPQNIMVAEDLSLRLSDFGMSLVIPSNGPPPTNPIGLGTPSYSAPELVKTAPSPFSLPADIFSLGVTLSVLLTAHEPFQGMKPAERMFMVGRGGYYDWEERRRLGEVGHDHYLHHLDDLVGQGGSISRPSSRQGSSTAGVSRQSSLRALSRNGSIRSVRSTRSNRSRAGSIDDSDGEGLSSWSKDALAARLLQADDGTPAPPSSIPHSVPPHLNEDHEEEEEEDEDEEEGADQVVEGDSNGTINVPAPWDAQTATSTYPDGSTYQYFLNGEGIVPIGIRELLRAMMNPQARERPTIAEVLRRLELHL